jgi:predicted GNAT family acetyltransferase
VTVRDNADELRYEIEEDGEVRGTIRYTRDDGVITLVHTEVDPKWKGHGVGSALVQGALDDLGARGLKVRPLCPFVAAYIRRHPEYEEIVQK